MKIYNKALAGLTKVRHQGLQLNLVDFPIAVLTGEEVERYV